MSDTMIEVLRYGGYVFAFFAVVFLALAIVLFFRYRIRDVFYELSGKGKAEMTEKMAANYAVTGTLRRTDVSTGQTGTLGGTTELGGRANTGGTHGRATTQTARKVSKNDKPAATGNTAFVIEKEITIVHSDERIA